MTHEHVKSCKENFIEEKAKHRKALYDNIKSIPDNPHDIYRSASIEFVLFKTIHFTEMKQFRFINVF